MIPRACSPRSRVISACLVLMLAPAAALSQTPNQPASPSRPPASSAPDDALAGPRVAAREGQRPTIVRRDFNGVIERPDATPAEAALDLITLDDDSRKAVRDVLARRAAGLDAFVRENLELLGQISNANQSGDRAESLRLLAEAAPKLRPTLGRAPLEEQLAQVLPEPKARELRHLVREYRNAVRNEAVTKARAQGETLTPAQATIRESLSELGQEIRRAYERQFLGRQAELDRVLAMLNLQPAQETRIRNLITEHVQATKGNPTQAQRLQLFTRIAAELDREQRATLLREYRGER